MTPGRIEAFLLGALGQVGKLSFGLYVLHPITRSWMTALFERGSVALTARSAYLFMGGWFSMTMVLSYLSYRFFEGPLLTWARDRSTAALEPQLTRPV